MAPIVHSASENKASGAEDCGNPIPNPGDGESIGKFPLSTAAAAGNFITKSCCDKCNPDHVQFSSSRYGIIACHTCGNFSIRSSRNRNLYQA
jgi:hypothetical protein